MSEADTTADPSVFWPTQLSHGDELGPDLSFTDLQQAPVPIRDLPAPDTLAPDQRSLWQQMQAPMSWPGAYNSEEDAQNALFAFKGGTDGQDEDFLPSTNSPSSIGDPVSDSTGTLRLDQPSTGSTQLVPPPEASRPGIYRSATPGMAPPMPFPDLGSLPAPPPGVINDPILRGYTEDNFRDAVIAKSPLFAESSAFGKDPAELGEESLNHAWANREIGHETSDTEYRIWRAGKARQYLNQNDASEKEIFDLGRSTSATIQAQAQALQQLYGRTIAQKFDDVAAGTDTPLANTFGSWTEQNRALIGQGNNSAYLAGAYQVAQRAQADIERLKVPAAHAWSAINQLVQGKTTPFAMDELGQELAAQTPEDRRAIYQYLVTAADANRIDRSVFDQIAQNMGKAISQSFDFMDKGGLQSMEGGARLWLNELGRGNVGVGDTGMPRFAYAGQPHTRPLTDLEKADLEKKFTDDLASYQVIRELMALRRKGIDPIVPVAPDGTWARTAETGLYGLGASTGPALAIAGGSLIDPVVGFALGADVIATDKYDDYRLAGMEPGAARKLSLATGAIESAAGLFDLRILAGHAPGFARLLQGLQPGVAKWTLTTGMSVASANLAQGAGDLATRFIEELGTTGEVNPERFKAIVGDWAKERPAAFFQLLPAALVGGGIANFRDFKDGGRFLLAPSFLKIVGFSPEQQARLATAKNQSEAEAIYREEFPKRTPENIAAGIEQLHATLDKVENQQGTSPGLVNPAKGAEGLPKTKDGRFLSEGSFRPLKDRVAENLDAVVDDYLKNHASNGKTNAIVINPDLVRDMDPAYRNDPMGQASNVHQDAVTVANAAYIKALQIAPPGKVIFLAGAPGSGKSTSLGPKTRAAIIVDRTLANYNDAAPQIQAAIDNGRAVSIHYMYRPLKETVTGTLKRALSETAEGNGGRPVNAYDIAYIYKHSRLNVIKFEREMRGKISVLFFKFNEGDPQIADRAYIENIPDESVQSLESEAHTVAAKWFFEHKEDKLITQSFRDAVLKKRAR